MTLVVAAIVAAWLLPYALVIEADLTPAQRASALASERRTILAAIAAIGAGIGLYYTHLRHQLNRDANATDRYAKAVEQLAHDDTAVRLGGLYALQRLGADSVRDAPTVTEVLGAFVRQHAPAAHDPQPWARVTAHIIRLRRRQGETAGRQLEVLTAVQVLGRRGRTGWRIAPPADLSRSNLDGLDLSELELIGANLTDSTARHTSFADCRLEGALFVGADLTKADFSGCDLTAANLNGANLTQALTIGTLFDGAVMQGAELKGLDYELLGAGDLNGVDVRGASYGPSDAVRLARAGAGIFVPASTAVEIRHSGDPADTELIDQMKHISDEELKEATAVFFNMKKLPRWHRSGPPAAPVVESQGMPMLLTNDDSSVRLQTAHNFNTAASPAPGGP